MSENSFFWTTSNVGDGPTGGYGATSMQSMVRGIAAIGDSGVMRGRLNELLVTSGSGNVSVASGEAVVYGAFYVNDAALTVTVPTPTVSTRQDRIILRFGSVAQTVRCVRLAGTEGAGLPALTQTSTTWELQIASISVTTGGVITTTPDTARFVKSPGVAGTLDGTTLEWDTTNKVARIKDGGVTAAKLPSPLSLSQYVATAAGSASSGGLYINSTNPGMGWNESDQATDEKMWDFSINAKTLLLRTVNDALNSATTILSIVRGAGIAIASFTINTALTLAAALTGTSATFSGQIKSNQTGGGSSSGVYIDAASPGYAWRESDQATDEKLWDMSVEGKVMSLRTVNDASNSVANIMQVTRGSGTAVSSIALGANTTVSGTLTANQLPALPNHQGGNTSDWATAGTTTYATSGVRMQTGAVNTTTSAGIGSITVAFPTAFSGLPTIWACVYEPTTSTGAYAVASGITNSQATFRIIYTTSAFTGSQMVMWFAVGPT